MNDNGNDKGIFIEKIIQILLNDDLITEDEVKILKELLKMRNYIE